MADLRAARRYASALFGVAVRQNALERIEADLRDVLDLWAGQPQIEAAMGRPQVPIETKQRIWQQLVGSSASPLLLDFLQLLVDKRRITLLPDIRTEFQRLADLHRQILRAQVITAVPLSADQAASLRARLQAHTGQTVELVPEVDPSIVGGAIVRIGDKIMDGSVRGSLARLRQRLAGAR